MRMLDVSRQSTGFAITVDQLRRAKADGYGGIIVGVWDGLQENPYAAETCANALTTEMVVAAYTAISPSGGWEAGTVAAQKVKSVLGDALYSRLSFVSIDVEVDGVTIAHIQQAVDAVIASHQRPVIYTARWFWVDHLGDPKDFASIPLWCAYYDGDPDFDFPSAPFGGWTASIEIGEQYQGTTSFEYGERTFGADLNAFKDEFLATAPGTPGGLAALRAAWEADMADTIMGAIGLHNGPIDPVVLGLYGIRQTQKSHQWARFVFLGQHPR